MYMTLKSNVSSLETNILTARQTAMALFDALVQEEYIQPGRSEQEISDAFFQLAEARYGIKKHWHKRIVRAGQNTLAPYAENPPNICVKTDDMVFLDMGPVFENYEADLGRSYVVGHDPDKLALVADLALIFNQ